MEPFAPPVLSSQIAGIKISLASPEQILAWSHGEVMRPETINYRSLKPEPDGLFCARIFGPINDWECLCGKYQHQKFNGLICDKCGVEVTRKAVRRERMGHIHLSSPVSHIWFFKGTPSYIGSLLDIPLKDLERVLYFEAYAVIEPGSTTLKKCEVISEETYRTLKIEHGELFRALMGAEAIQELLKRVDIEALTIDLRAQMKAETSNQKRFRIGKRLQVAEAFFKSGLKPEWMILNVIPVLPPELRPVVALGGGRFATSDLNDLYRRVINRNNRLKKLLELRAPEVIVVNEKRMLQEAVDALFENGKRGRLLRSVSNRPLKSLSDALKGKQGRFRQNLLGKRVDYSGRSVIVVGPDLKLHQCGLPKKMALELFKPFIFNRLEHRGHTATIREAKEMVEQGVPEVWDVLEEVIQNHPVMLNRAPTLHRLGIQAFQPVLVEGKAIRLHPLVCAAFNADFDGDQMAVHLPLSPMAQIEARVLMAPEQNLLSHQNGKPIMAPTREMLLGCYYLTMAKAKLRGEGKIFTTLDEVVAAREAGIVDTHAIIRVRMSGGLLGEITSSASNRLDTLETTPLDQPVKILDAELITTTVGRVIFNLGLPVEIPFLNLTITKDVANDLIKRTLRFAGKEPGRACAPSPKNKKLSEPFSLKTNCQDITVRLLDALMQLGFEWATRSGLSIGLSDLSFPPSKGKRLAFARERIKRLQEDPQGADPTGTFRFGETMGVWYETQSQIEQDLVAMHSMESDSPLVDPLGIIIHSGAGLRVEQLRELSGMIGVVVNASGALQEKPVDGAFVEGLAPAEYFATIPASRQRMIEHSIGPADAGYLTRKLVNAVQDLVIREEDCGSSSSIELSAVHGRDPLYGVSLAQRMLGRVLAKDVQDPMSGRCIARTGQTLDTVLVSRIEQAGVTSVHVRSPLMCRADRGVCAACYGNNPATGQSAQVGDAVGILAAHALSEFATQATLDGKHQRANIQQAIRAGQGVRISQSGVIQFSGVTQTENLTKTKKWCTSTAGRILLLGINGEPLGSWHVPSGAELFVEDGIRVDAGTWLFRADPGRDVIRANCEGEVSIEITTPAILGNPSGCLNNQILFLIKNNQGRVQNRVLIPFGYTPIVPEGCSVVHGSILAVRPRILTKARSGFHRVGDIISLMEARRPITTAPLAGIKGTVYIGRNRKKPACIEIIGDDHETEYVDIPSSLPLRVKDRDRIMPGTPLTEGPCDLSELFRLAGKEKTYAHAYAALREAIQDGGHHVLDIHLEILLSRMMSWMTVLECGDTPLMENEIVSEKRSEIVNTRTMLEGGVPAKFAPCLLGATKVSLRSDSFLAAAAFQDTTRVLAQAAVEGRVDYLQGPLENVMLGLLVPAGTGLPEFRALKIEEGQYPEETDDGDLGPEDCDDEYSRMATHLEELQGMSEVNGEDI